MAKSKSVAEDELFEKLRRILANKLKMKENEINKQSHIVDDIGIDSVDFWEIIAKIEQEFGIDVEDDDVKGVNTVQDVVDVLKKKIGDS